MTATEAMEALDAEREASHAMFRGLLDKVQGDLAAAAREVIHAHAAGEMSEAELRAADDVLRGHHG